MTTYKVGDVVGQCPGFDKECGGEVTYQGGVDAVCQKCGSTYAVAFDQDEEGEQVERPVQKEVPEEIAVKPTVADPPVSEFATPPVEQPKKVTIPEAPLTPDPVKPTIIGEEVGKLSDPVMGDPNVLKKHLQLDPEKVDANPDDIGLPAYIKKTRPWKWAQVMSKTGNPYRENTKSWKVFNIFSQKDCTVEEAIAECPSIGLSEKLSYILTVYEVVTQCACAGLLVIDKKTRIISVCTGLPQPAEMP
ncbi:MAG: hypothetical protein ACXABY_25980 [Candidatus Thorarchaeota archaeon]